MTSSEKTSKRKGIIGTILFHALLLVAFLFMGLTYQDPPPAEEGISINFGFVDEGLGEVEPEDTEEESNSIDSQDSDNTSTENTQESPSDNSDDSKKSKEIFIYKDKVVESKEDFIV